MQIFYAPFTMNRTIGHFAMSEYIFLMT